MADLNIVSAGVLAGNNNAVTATAYSAGTISAGQVLWLNSSTNPPVVGTAVASSQSQATNVVGIALDNAVGANQLITYAVSGTVLLPTTGTGGTLTNGAVYVLSAGTAGNMISASDPLAPGASNFITLIGVALNPSTLLVNITPLGAFR